MPVLLKCQVSQIYLYIQYFIQNYSKHLEISRLITTLIYKGEGTRMSTTFPKKDKVGLLPLLDIKGYYKSYNNKDGLLLKR